MSELITLLFGLGIAIIAATFFSLIAKWFKQPLIIGYILAGIIIGPHVLGLVYQTELINLFSELGIAFLLFIVGLELDLAKLKKAGAVSITAGLIQVILVFLIGFYVATIIGFQILPAAYLGLIVAFSSTAVVIKILGDKNELDTLHGRIILGILLIQDIIVVVALSILTTINTFSVEILLESLVKGLGLVGLAILISQFIIPSVFKRIQKTPEILFLVSTSILFLFVGLSYSLGFSTAIGGFIAGLSMSYFPYNMEIISRAISLRDFFVTIFFVSLGMLVDLSGILPLLGQIIIFAIIAVLIKPAIIALIAGLYNYKGKVALTSGINLGQISEFSLVVAILGLSLNHISNEIFTIAATLLLATTIWTSYSFKYQRPIVEKLTKVLYGRKDLKSIEEELMNLPNHLKDHIILLGAHEKGRKLIRHLQNEDKTIVVVDHDPDRVRQLKEKGFFCIYGEASNPEILDKLNYKKASLVISTIPTHDENKYFTKKIKENEKTVFFANAESVAQALEIYDLGADYVLYDKMIAGETLLSMIVLLENNKQKVRDFREKQIKELEHREEEDILEKYGPRFLKSIKRRLYAGNKKRSRV